MSGWLFSHCVVYWSVQSHADGCKMTLNIIMMFCTDINDVVHEIVMLFAALIMLSLIFVLKRDVKLQITNSRHDYVMPYDLMAAWYYTNHSA